MRKKNLIIIVMCVAICVMVVGYGAFNTLLTITGTANIASEWKVVFTNITQVSKTSGVNVKATPVASGTSATFNVGLTSPGDKIVYEITIENKGTINAIIENIVASASDSPAIIFSIDGINIGDKIPNKTSKTLTVTIEYDKSVTSQPEKTNKVLTVDMTVVQDAGQTITPVTPDINQPLYAYLSGAILKDNIAQADTNITFAAISGDTNGKGLYYTSTNTEEGKTTYYFRGAVENNYVKFGKDSSGNDLYWKIIRINEDGSIRIIYNGTSTTATGSDVTIGNSKFNENSNDNAHVGYMYGTTGQSGTNAYNLTHSNDNSSTIKTFLDDWYVSNLSSYAGYLADAGFCNDRSVAPSAGLWYSNDTALGYAKNKTYYGAYNRLKTNKKPQFACPNEGRDLFTTSTSTKGNKKLTNPIGLITADEVWYAGAITTTNIITPNKTHYLYTGAIYWTMSPWGFVDASAVEWDLESRGYLNTFYVGHSDGVRPVVNLRSGVELSTELPSGCTKLDGTANCPYIIKTN